METPGNNPRNDSSEQLRHLRSLLVGPTDDSVEALRKEVQGRSVTAKEVGSVLAEAIQTSPKEKISRVLAPTLSKAFQDSVKREPQALVDAISPIMGPAIRRAISQQIQAMVQSLNTALEHSLSPKSLRWRFEAYRTGKPFAEVVLIHTLVYRIEQLLLIDPKTGLLMQSVSANPGGDDADLVSALLTAIQDFTRDSFEHRSSDDSGSDLQSMKTNELNVWIEHGPSAILAAAVRGEPPVTVRQRMQEVLERLHIEYRTLMTNYCGDPATLEIVQPDLEGLLESEYINQRTDSQQQEETPTKVKEKSKWKKHLSWVVPASLLLLALTTGLAVKRQRYRQHIAALLDLPPTAQIHPTDSTLRVTGSARHDWIKLAQNRMDRLPEFRQLDLSLLTIADEPFVSFVKSVRETPGLIITSSERRGDHYWVRGWRDPLADDPEALMAANGLDRAGVTCTWERYHSVDSRLALARLKKHLKFPRTITSVQQDEQTGKLVLRGSAKAEWLDRLRYTVSILESGITIDASKLKIRED